MLILYQVQLNVNGKDKNQYFGLLLVTSICYVNTYISAPTMVAENNDAIDPPNTAFNPNSDKVLR